MEAVLAGKFRILSVIHQSGKRIVYEAVDLKDGRQLAIKMAQDQSQNERIQRQSRSYNRLALALIGNGFAVKHYCDTDGPRHFIVLDLLGDSLETKLKQCGGSFSYKTTLMLADQMLRRIEALHDIGMVHRDVKPASFLIGRANQKKIHLIDLGAASAFLQKGDHIHIQYSQGHKPHGTLRFCSINAHLRTKLSRRDDLHSLMYCILYFLNGRLPWQGIQAKSSKEKQEIILGKKVQNRGEILFKKCPNQLRRMMEHIEKLHFADKPDYEFLKSEIAGALRTLRQEYDFHYDWDK